MHGEHLINKNLHKNNENHLFLKRIESLPQTLSFLNPISIKPDGENI